MEPFGCGTLTRGKRDVKMFFHKALVVRGYKAEKKNIFEAPSIVLSDNYQKNPVRQLVEHMLLNILFFKVLFIFGMN